MEAPPRVGRYELLERIGQGSMGVLYRGRDSLLGREVAVKVMGPGFLGDVAAHARFFREAKAAARLQHVNIVTIFEFGEHDDTPYIVMEFLRGGSLAERLRDDPTMSLRDKLDAAIQLCAGLEAAHTQGVVHRDIKPANVWICQDGTVKLLDFGIATAASSAATFAEVMGSPGYMSPEQIAGKDVDGRADIFSCGVVLYEMLSGRRPFEGDSPTAVMLKIINECADPIDDAELPSALTSAVLRAMEKAPDARYARASELGRDLKAVRADLPTLPEPGTLLFDQTVLHVPPPSPVSERLSVRFLALLEELPRIRLVRPPVAAVVLVGLAAVLVGWAVWPAKQVAPRFTTVTGGSTPGMNAGGSSSPLVKNGAPPPVDPPAVSLVTLRVNSQPSAAKILIDGRDTGKRTPADIPIEPSRPASIRLEMPGFKTEEVRVSADALRSGTINAVLSPRAPAPRVTLVATGEYKFDVMDRQRVLSPASERHDVVVTGLRSVQLRSDQYFLNHTVRVDRVEGSTVKASAPPLGSITIYASGTLEDCKVFIDDRIVDSGSFPVANREIASGTHRVKLSCSRGETDAQTVNVPSHQNASTRFPGSTPVRPR
jgi:serine/threonine-protein kinase